MSISSFLGLQTSLRGLQAQQQALDVAAHNVANANTVGYTRQQAALGASSPLHLQAGAVQSGAGAFLGQGVDVAAFNRIRDSFLDLQVRAQTTALGDSSTTAQSLDNVQSAVGEPSTTGINSLMSKFFSAWSDFSNHPADAGSKAAVTEAANTLVDALKGLGSSLTDAAGAAQQQLTTLTGSTGPIQASATQIAQLNKAIDAAIDAGQSPNDLLDKRDQLLDDLSQYGQVSVVPQANGRIQVAFEGQTIVDDQTTPSPLLPSSFAPQSGQTGALYRLVNQTIPAYQTALEDVATTLRTSVNNAMTGAGGSAMFTGTSIATMGVDASAVVAGSGSGAASNNIALAVMAAGEQANGAADKYAAFVRQVGADMDNATRAQSVAQAAVNSAEDRRQSVSGVSLDEEMANMLAFQRGYQASARVMSTVDDMLDTLINRAGRVGL
jgi:flagellar hook-associated protein 1